MRHIIISSVILLVLLGCKKQQLNTEQVLKEYIQSANEHNLEKVYLMYSDNIEWQFGTYTFSGKEEAIAPLRFDKGANTFLTIKNINANGDTLDFELIETNDVIKELGIPKLHHFPRFILKDGLIYRISESRPPLEIRAYVDSVSAFAMWLSDNRPKKFEQFWPNGKFNFSEETGKEMPLEVAEWRNRFVNNSEEKN